MRDYGKVHTSFWASDTIRAVDDDARLLALYLLTSTHTHMSGVFRLPSAYACEDLGWVPERLANGFRTLSDADWLRRCERTGWVWIRNYGRFNPPDNPNQRKACEKQLALVPKNCSFFAELTGCSEPLSNGSCNPPIPIPTPIPTPKGVESIPLDDGTEFEVTEPMVAEFRRAYPRIDVVAEVRKARVWCMSNPANRKTRKGAPRFLNSWLARAEAESVKASGGNVVNLPGGGRRAL